MYTNHSGFQEDLSGLDLEGFLTITKVFLDGTKEVIFQDKNLIVNGVKLIILSQLYYSATSGDPLSYARIGIGGASDLAGLILRVPGPTMTNLYDPQISVPILKTAHNDSLPSITLMANVDNAVGNGLRLNEAGFFTASGIMFNIKTFPYVDKDSRFSLNLEWVIKI